jgi:putative copper export protein
MAHLPDSAQLEEHSGQLLLVHDGHGGAQDHQPQHQCNKALHIIKVLQWLADNCMVALGKAAQESLKRSLKKLH